MDREYWQDFLLTEEKRLGLTQGFKMLYGPWSTLAGASVAFLSLNPGGRVPDGADLRTVSDERGNSYWVEAATTRSPITGQFLRLADMLGTAPDDILTGVVAPFRTATWDDLNPDQKRASLEIGRRFWRDPLAQPGLRLIVAITQEAAELAVSIRDARPDGERLLGWDPLVVRRFRDDLGAVIVHLPHLSRFKLFGRPASEPALRWAFGLGGRGAPDVSPGRASLTPATDRSSTATAGERKGASPPKPDAMSVASSATRPVRRPVLDRIASTPGFTVKHLTKQSQVWFGNQQVGGLNRPDNHWYVLAPFLERHGGPAEIERRGFRKTAQKLPRGVRYYWKLKASGAPAAFLAALEQMTGETIAE